MMNSILKATVCAAAVAFAVPAMAQTDNMAPHHHHHAMHGKHAGMSKGTASGDADTARLNDQSLANAKAGVMPAGEAGSGSMPGSMAAPGAMAAPGTMAPPGAMAAPGTGMTAPTVGTGSTATPGAMAAPTNGMSTPTAPASGAMGGATSTNAPAMAPTGTGTGTDTGTTPNK